MASRAADKLEEIAVAVAEIKAEFAPVRKVVYGAIGVVGASFIGALAVVAWRVFGL